MIQSGPEQLNDSDFRTIEVDNKYSIDLPNYMSEGDLNDEASLEYQHLFKETYVIVIDENITEAEESLRFYSTYNDNIPFIENYINFQKDGFDDDSQVISMSRTNSIEINGYPAKQFEMVLDIPDFEDHIAYLATFIESSDHVFMLLNWTLESRKERYMDTFKTIANSFRATKRRSKTKRN